MISAANSARYTSSLSGPPTKGGAASIIAATTSLSMTASVNNKPTWDGKGRYASDTTCAGPQNLLSGMSSNVCPSSCMWIGASTCVPVCDPNDKCRTSYPSF